MNDPFRTYGSPQLSAWQVAPGEFWIQTTSPDLARKLAKREDAARVGVYGTNHYRQTFAIRGTWRKLRRIIDHYLETSAGDQDSPRVVPTNRRNKRASLTTAAAPSQRPTAASATGGSR